MPKSRRCPVCGTRYLPGRAGECLGCGYQPSRWAIILWMVGILLWILLSLLFEHHGRG